MTPVESSPALDLVIVDTSGWIAFLARKGFPEIKKAIAGLLDEDRIATTDPIFLELIQGTRTQDEKEGTARRLRALHWLRVTDEHWYEASSLAFDLRRKGVTVPAMDALIAVLAIDYDCELLYSDGDYNLIAEHSSLRVFTLTSHSPTL
ncbi:MAG: PIN domain-containing protein [Candidatus Latescibacteria bacterium]|nr:PIN domain-containing protein [Candidatus Latescibacterota bacterium]